MARPLRIQYPDAWYHVMNRSRSRAQLFSSREDYSAFIELLKDVSSLWKVRIAAYCLMSNHYHLLFQTPEANLSRCMRHINGLYTQYFNRIHKSDGQIFRGRYKCIVIDGDSYLLQLVRYILFAPTSTAMTWSIADVEQDAKLIALHLEDVYLRVNIDRSRILLTGMSDGGTYALGLALSPDSIYRSVAPVACALAPVDFLQAKGKRICWIHGAQDWIFTAAHAAYSCKELKQAGADIKLKILPDLSHTYPREENDTILRWFQSANA